MTCLNQQITVPSKPITLEEIQRRCEAIEGYMDLGLSDEALKTMQQLSSELRIANNGVEFFMNVLMKHPMASTLECFSEEIGAAKIALG
jgi:hypothetical protein